MAENPTKYSVDRKALEKRVLWKMDTRILPTLLTVYYLSSPDRINMRNGLIAGLDADLNLKTTELYTAISVFFLTCVLCEVPSNAVLKKFKANRWLGFLMFSWALVTIVTGFTRNYAQLIAVRLMLGLFGGGFVPGIVGV